MDVLAWIASDHARYLALSQAFLFVFAAIVAAGACWERAGTFFSAKAGTAIVLAAAFLALPAARGPVFFIGVWGPESYSWFWCDLEDNIESRPSLNAYPREHYVPVTSWHRSRFFVRRAS